MKISADLKKKAFHRVQQPPTIKILKLGIESNFFNMMKANILNCKRQKSFLLNSRTGYDANFHHFYSA